MNTILLLGAFLALHFLRSACSSDITVRTAVELFDVLNNTDASTIYMHDSLQVDPRYWLGTVVIKRSVLLSATPDRSATGTYVLLDFNNVAMMFQLVPGISLVFRGLELANQFDSVGPTFRPVRQSVNATVVFDRCILLRRAGLPYKAAIVNMREAARPPGMSGPQVCDQLSTITYLSTRSPNPITYPGAINMSDYATVVLPDSSLAYQNLYYGGFTYMTKVSYYIAEYIVSDECLAQRPGTECVTLLLQQLDGDSAPSGGGSSDNSKVIIIAVVVPIAAVLLASMAVAAMLVRRRQRRRLKDAARRGQDPEAAAGGGGDGKGRTPSSAGAAHLSGCVFMGLEENQPLPEWSPLEEEDDEDDDDGRGGKFRSGSGGDKLLTDSAGPQLPRSGTPPSSRLKPDNAARSTAAASGGSAAAAAAAAGSVGGSSRAALATAAPSERGGGGGGGGSGTGTVTGSGSGPMAELGRLAQQLRATVQDESIKLECVIGCGSFGTVYRGTWRGLAVAVKTLVFSASDDNRRRALQEAALCASISHPNVVATYSSELQPLGAVGPKSTDSAGPPPSAGAVAAPVSGPGADGGPGSDERPLSPILDWRLYIVQEYADGGPLRKLYGNRSLWPSPGVVNMPGVVALALGIARALSHLHSKRIIHGDLNPNNVLLKSDPNEPSGYIVKVGDFGLSVMLPQNRTHLSNLRMGTMFYMCPAVVMKGQVGPPSDVFSMGVMLWELYHGRRAGIRTDQGPRYSSIFPAFPPTCPEAYRAVALHCLQRQPQNRPAAAVVEAHLERLYDIVTAAAGGPAASCPGSNHSLGAQPPAAAARSGPNSGPGAAAGGGARAPGAGFMGSVSVSLGDGTLTGSSSTLPPTQYTNG